MSTAAKKRKVIDIVPPTHSEECRMLWTRQRSCGLGVFWCSICCMNYDDDDIYYIFKTVFISLLVFIFILC